MATQADTKAMQAMRHWVDHPEDRTAALIDLAEALIEMRSTFFTNEGDVDWRGRSWDYRKHVGDLYEEAGISDDDRHHIQTAVRYHVGNKLRDVLSSEELLRSDMLPSSPKTRLNAQRALGNILLHQQTGETPLWRMHPNSPRTWLLSVKALTAAMEQMEELSAEKLSSSARYAVLNHLNELHQRLESVADRLE